MDRLKWLTEKADTIVIRGCAVNYRFVARAVSQAGGATPPGAMHRPRPPPYSCVKSMPMSCRMEETRSSAA